MKKGTLRELFRTGHNLIGTFIHMPSPDLVEIVGQAGFDFVVVDTEHGSFGAETAIGLVRAADAVGIHSIVRVSENSPSLICKALDMGADGVLIPQIQGASDAQAAVKAARYHPLGQRGVFPYMRGSGYSARGGTDFFARANRETAVLLLIEGVAGVNSLGEILSVPGVDAIFLGPMDLSQSVGVPGQPSHPAVQEKLADILSQTREQGIAAGVYAHDLQSARQWLVLGASFIAYLVDSAIIYVAYHSLAQTLAAYRNEAPD